MPDATMQALIKQAFNKKFVLPVTDYQWGFKLFCNGYDVSLCHNDEQRRGFRAALRAAAMSEGGEAIVNVYY